MKLKLIAASVLCSAALFSAVDARAASPFVANDLILSFDSTGGTGASTDLEVDLGNFQTLNYMGSGLSLSLNTVLTSVYGSSWSTDGDVSWAVVGANSTSQAVPGSTIYVTDPTGDSTSVSTVGIQHAAASAVFSIYGAQSLTSVTGITGGTISNSVTASFDVQNDASGSTGSGIEDVTGNDLMNINGSNTTMDLFDLVPSTNSGVGGSDTDINTFTLNTNGTFTAATAAVPEPSTWATLIAGVASLAALRFRRRRA